MNCIALSGDPPDPGGDTGLSGVFPGGVESAKLGKRGLLLGSGVRGARGGVPGVVDCSRSVEELIHFSC
jgi:hypothetical protein